MPTYKYKATAMDGKSVEGTEVANSRGEVVALLRGKKQFPVKIEEVEDGKDSGKQGLVLFKSIKIKEIAIFCRQFHTMLNSGVSIIACLDILRRQTGNKRLRQEIYNVYEYVQKGQTLSEAMKACGDTFPPLLLNMVEAGEASGNLDSIMDRMAEHYEKENKINNKVKTAMVYPIILSILAISVVVFLLIFVMPTFVGMFQSSGVELPLPTRILLLISDTIIRYWYLIAAAAALGIYGLRLYLKSKDGRYLFDSIKLRLPVVKDTSIKIATSRFSRTLSILLASGIPLLEGLEIVSRIVGNKVLEKHILQAMEEVRKGSPLSRPIKSIGYFPPMLDSMIQIGEESGALDEILDRTANFYDEEVDTAIQKMTAMLEPLMIVIMALLIGAIIIAMILPMFDMIKTIQ